MKTALLKVVREQAAKWAKSKGFNRGTSHERKGFRASLRAYERRLAALEPTMTYKELTQVVRETVETAQRMTTGA